MNLVWVAQRISKILEPRFGKERSQDRAANLVTGVACNYFEREFELESIENNIKQFLEAFRDPYHGGFEISDNELEELTQDTLVIIFEELPPKNS